MGENKYIEELDDFAKKYVKEIEQEEPNLDFTDSVMQKIVSESTSNVFSPKALITKKGWVLIISLLLVALFFPFKQNKATIITIPELDFSFLNKFQIPNFFESLLDSSTILFSVFLFGIMIIAQMFLLKRYFEKRI